MIWFQTHINKFGMMLIKYHYLVYDIDKSFTGERSDQTQYQVNKVKELQDSLNRWIARADKMNDKDTLFKEVYFSVDVTKKDGSKIKNKPFRIYFDLDGDVSAEMMDRAMGK